MTLVLTELSNAGIVMAVDSAITKISRGKIIEVDQKGWNQLLRVPRIRAAISYLCLLGAVTQKRFDYWLQKIIKSDNYDSLQSLADYLAEALNDACQGKPLDEGQDVGIHVAGYSQWPDRQSRPFFFHVHNGHGRFIIQHKTDEQGKIIAVHPKWVSESRKLFEKHQDFPSLSNSVEENIINLQQRPITRNGTFFIYAIIWQHLQRAIEYINLIPNVAIPRSPSDLASRKGFLHTILEVMVRLYRCSNQSRIVGGAVRSLAIGPERYIL